MHPLAADNAEAAGRLQGRPVAVEVAAFLDHWSYVRRRARGVTDETWKPLLDVALRVDPDVARTRVRRGVLRLGWAKVADLVEPGDLDSLHGTSLKALVTHKGTPPRVMALLRLARQRRPDDYWVNRALGLALRTQDPPRWEEVIECYRAAVALRPRSAAAHVTLGSALKWKGRLEEAISCFRDATRHQPDSATAHYYLGFCLRKQGKYSEATACFQEAIRHHPGYAEAQRFLADGLMREGKVEEAIARYRELIRLRPDQIRAHRELGYALRKKGELDEAIRCFEAALRLRPDQAHAHVGLGLALGDIGRFAESLAAFRRAHQLGPKLPDWRYDSAKWVADAERLAELERKLPAVLEGKQCPADGTEAAGLAKVAAVKKLSVAAARLYQEAFVAAPTLASRPSKGHRYRAACQAALAGCGQGADSGGLDEKERSRLRKQALAWLRADLKSLNRLLDKQPDEPPPSVA
ncbi:MAG: tetratricopeptide repeat protein, partial [Gemmataceae bacterium]